MTTVITINHNIPTELIFDLEIEGLSALTSLESRFLLQTSSHHMCFKCEKLADKQWRIPLPALSMLEKGQSYGYAIEVIADGYFFKALEGTASVQENIKSVKATNITTSSIDDPKEKIPTPATMPVSQPKQLQTVDLITKSSSTDVIKNSPKDSELPLPQKVSVKRIDVENEESTEKEQHKSHVEQKEGDKEKEEKLKNILSSHQQESERRKHELISKGVAEALAIREKNRKVQQILKEHNKQKD